MKVAGFLARFGAFLIDDLIIVIFLYLGELLLPDFFVGLAHCFNLIGFIISTVYFGLMDSKLFSEQTFGKKILGVVVISTDGAYLNIARSMGRYFLISILGFVWRRIRHVYPNRSSS